MRERLPLVEQARVDLPHELAEPLDEVGQLLGARRLRDRLPRRAVGVGQVAQHEALAAPELVERDELGEAHRPLVQVAHDRLG